ncbi:MAG: hypothetical protein GXO07_01820 [Crenarchaeota archaeon]|nr:hypothetical protein [Thermoproteota archaeon]
MTPEERVVVEYFVTFKSVGEIIALQELRRKGIKRPTLVLDELIRKGIIRYGEGCYSLAKEYRT